MTTAHTSEGRVALDPKRRPVHSPGPAVLPDPYKDNLRPSSPLRPASPPGMQFGTSSDKRFKDPPTNNGPKRVNNRAKTAGVRITARSQTLSIDRSTDNDYEEPVQYTSMAATMAFRGGTKRSSSGTVTRSLSAAPPSSGDPAPCYRGMAGAPDPVEQDVDSEDEQRGTGSLQPSPAKDLGNT